ncbi:uncharacterized protein [Watersipora subatra]|uniref:uncharacterized protein isoform X1 n=1 Tax=Watersipora subatra TaxID=2589382 RepID=UPI00355AE222
MAQQPSDEGGEPLMRFETRDDRQCRADYGDIDKGPMLREPPMLEEVVDNVIEMVRDYKESPSILEMMRTMLWRYLENPSLDHFHSEEFDDESERVFARLRHLATDIEKFYDNVWNLTEAQQIIEELLNDLCQKILEIKRGCAVCALEFKDEVQIAQFIQESSTIAKKLRDWLKCQFFKKEEISVEMERHNLFQEAAVETVERLFESIRTNVRVHVIIPNKQLLRQLEGFTNTVEVEETSDTVDVTFIAKLGNFPFPTDDEADDKMDIFIEQFRGFKNVQKAFKDAFLTAKSSSSMLQYEQQMLAGSPEKRMQAMKLEQKELQESETEKGAAASSKPRESKPFYTIFIEKLQEQDKPFDLLKRFKKYGTILYTIIDRHRHAGYVRFESASAAEKAASSGQGVTLAQQSEPLYLKRSKTTLELMEFPNPDKKTLENLCSPYGEISRVAVIPRHSKAFVVFKEAESASKALAGLQAANYYVFMAKPQ